MCRPKARNSLDCTNLLATFLLQKVAQEKSYQKRTPIRGFRPLRRATNARALDRRHLLKKVDENFHQTDETRLFCLQSGICPLTRADLFYVIEQTLFFIGQIAVDHGVQKRLQRRAKLFALVSQSHQIVALDGKIL